MLRKPVVLITGACGEIGHGLIHRLSEAGERTIVTLDLNPLPGDLLNHVHRHINGSILDQQLLDRVAAEFEIDRIYHLAALLSTRSEFVPMTAHRVNVEGTLNLLEFAQRQGESHGRSVLFLYPSSIAAYGMPSLEIKNSAGAVREDEYNHPTTMYGCNKLYCEHLGSYYAQHYKQLSAEVMSGKVDFRCIRFPGLISAYTLPSGGTSDYAPEMIHAAAQGKEYACFVRPDSRIPFMAMPDSIEAILRLAAAPREKLTRFVYNINAMNPAAEEFRELVHRYFGTSPITTQVDARRQGIVDSWPAAVDDSAARSDWGFAPRYDRESIFTEYLVPVIKKRYS